MIITAKASPSVRSGAPAVDPITTFWYAIGWALIAVGVVLGILALTR